MEINDNGRYTEIITPSATYKLDNATAQITSIAGKNGEILKTPLALSLWRAPTDNDRFVKADWVKCRYYETYSEPRKCEIAGNVVRYFGAIAPVKLVPVAEYILTYEFFDDAVSVSIDYTFASYVTGKLSAEEKTKGAASIDMLPPRIGLCTEIDKSFSKVRYYGYGSNEAYVDKRIACIKDVYEYTVGDNEYEYVRPQEHGSHYGTEMMEITDGKTVIRVEDDFSFSALPHSAKTYTDTKHSWELPESTATHLSLDFHMSGIGSNSCGPKLADEWKIPVSDKRKITIFVK